MNFYPFSKGVANFKFIFLCHFSINFERFGAYPAAFMQNFPKHTNFFPFWWISAELWPLFLRSHFFLVHPVYLRNIFRGSIWFLIFKRFAATHHLSFSTHCLLVCLTQYYNVLCCTHWNFSKIILPICVSIKCMQCAGWLKMLRNGMGTFVIVIMNQNYFWHKTFKV